MYKETFELGGRLPGSYLQDLVRAAQRSRASLDQTEPTKIDQIKTGRPLVFIVRNPGSRALNNFADDHGLTYRRTVDFYERGIYIGSTIVYCDPKKTLLAQSDHGGNIVVSLYYLECAARSGETISQVIKDQLMAAKQPLPDFEII